MMRVSCVTVLMALVLSTGCAAMAAEAARVRVLNPKPLVDLPESADAMTLQLDPTIADAFGANLQSGSAKVPVEKWRASLTNGFKNGIARFFRGVDTSRTWTLVVLHAELDYVPTAVAMQGSTVGVAAAQARIRYAVRLIDPADNVVIRGQGEAFSTTSWTNNGGSRSTASEAIGAMYEQIAKELNTLSAPTPAPAQQPVVTTAL